MPVIVLEARDFTSPLFLVRTLEVLSICTAFSLVASLGAKDLQDAALPFRTFCMFTWCFFFAVTLFIHILFIIQFHNLIRISWKNLTMTVAVLGLLMNLSSSVLFPWKVMDRQKALARPVAASVASGLTFLAYTSECFILRSQAQEQRGYMGSFPGILKNIQLWGGFQMIPVIVLVIGLNDEGPEWQQWVSCASYGVCFLLSLITLLVIVGDLAGRCLLPFDKLLAVFSLLGVLLYMLSTVICLTKILQLESRQGRNTELVIMETVVASVTLLSYTVDLAFSIKLLCDRSHM